MSIQLQQQVLATLQQLAKVMDKLKDIDERLAVLERKEAERKKLGRPPKVNDGQDDR